MSIVLFLFTRGIRNHNNCFFLIFASSWWGMFYSKQEQYQKSLHQKISSVYFRYVIGDRNRHGRLLSILPVYYYTSFDLNILETTFKLSVQKPIIDLRLRRYIMATAHESVAHWENPLVIIPSKRFNVSGRSYWCGK